jgi:hypothetical protein
MFRPSWPSLGNMHNVRTTWEDITSIKHYKTNFTFTWPCIVTNFFIIKPNRCTNFSNLFWNETLHISDSSSVHHQELFTVHSAMVYVEQDQDGILTLLESCLQNCMTHTIAECTVNKCWWWTEELSEIYRFSFQNKFEKLLQLVGFIIRKFVTMHCHMNVKNTPTLYSITWLYTTSYARTAETHLNSSHHINVWVTAAESLNKWYF